MTIKSHFLTICKLRTILSLQKYSLPYDPLPPNSRKQRQVEFLPHLEPDCLDAPHLVSLFCLPPLCLRTWGHVTIQDNPHQLMRNLNYICKAPSQKCLVSVWLSNQELESWGRGTLEFCLTHAVRPHVVVFCFNCTS